MDQTLSALGKRVFLLHNVHEDAPEVFETRWTMSYLRGPLTRDQIRTLMAPVKAAGVGPPAARGRACARTAREQPRRPPATPAHGSRARTRLGGPVRPVLPPDVPQYFLPPVPRAAPHYEPWLWASAQVDSSDTKLDVRESRTVTLLARRSPTGRSAWTGTAAEPTDVGSPIWSQPAAGRDVRRSPPAAAKPKSYAVVEQGLRALALPDAAAGVAAHAAPA